MKKHIKNNVNWVGFLDWELKKFHGDDYSIMHGSSQNAYLIQDEKTVLIDTVWTPHRFDFIENLKKEIDLKKIDFIVANHGECDHSGSLTALLDEIPNTPIYCTAACVKSLEGQYGKRGWNFKVVKTGDSVEIGGLLGTAPIMKVNEFGCDEFVNRGGRIPAPIHSFKN